MNNKTLNIKISPELYERLQNEARKKNISLASLVRMLCSDYFEEKK